MVPMRITFVPGVFPVGELGGDARDARDIRLEIVCSADDPGPVALIHLDEGGRPAADQDEAAVARGKFHGTLLADAQGHPRQEDQQQSRKHSGKGLQG